MNTDGGMLTWNSAQTSTVGGGSFLQESSIKPTSRAEGQWELRDFWPCSRDMCEHDQTRCVHPKGVYIGGGT